MSCDSDNDSDDASPLQLTKLVIEGEPDRNACSVFIPTNKEESVRCWELLIKHLEKEYGIIHGDLDNFELDRLVTAQELLNIYYIYDNFPSEALYTWIMVMQNTKNLSEEVSLF